MKKIKYIVEYYEEEEYKKEWVAVPLEMCRGGFLCKECKKDIAHLDNCDNMFYYTFDKQVAIDRKGFLERDGFKARIIEK